jgi:hypothetical protein
MIKSQWRWRNWYVTSLAEPSAAMFPKTRAQIAEGVVAIIRPSVNRVGSDSR